MEAKVHEATNNEPWGPSNTLMQEIAQGTYNYQYFNEILPTIYKRFTEKESRYWRQIYKALVLLEYLIKNGSERVIDDIRTHVSLIKVMRNFYYIDENGKDEGINVRNRAKEIVELLSDTDKIREERKIAKKNRNKFVGVGSDGGYKKTPSLGSRFIGFGSDTGRGISFSGDAINYGEEQPYPQQRGKYDDEDDEEEEEFEEYGEQKKDADSDNDSWGEYTWGGEEESSSKAIDDDFDDFQYAVDNTTTTTPTTNPPPTTMNLLDTDSDLLTPSLDMKSISSENLPVSEDKKADTPDNTIASSSLWADAFNFVSLDSLGKTEKTHQTAGPSMNALRHTTTATYWDKQPTTKEKSVAFDDLLL
ncbi:hypothetical protein BDB01DRAFT_843299 [Pilobolus umbonatus]|nr:hypothetical protein BDB01DRAFT_843299 [Pilobolus umbonatus]